jgi:hypothetical protein
MMHAAAAAVTVAVMLAACADPPRSFGDPTGDPELPPRGEADLEPWIRTGHYLAWACEPVPVDVRPGSPHRPQTRTCSNQLARTPGTGELPVGAATVKEMYDDAGRIMGYGVSRKVEAGGAEGWYWYERLRDRNPNADGMNEGSCPACHEGATRDFTFVIVP